MLNNVVLIGRLCKDPDLKYTASGKAVATLRIAVDRGTKDADGKSEADFVDIIAWEKVGETAANYLTKGRLIAVQGRLQIRQFEHEGVRREKAEVVASQVRFLDKGNDANPSQPRDGEGRDVTGGLGGEPNFNDDDDVPF